MQNGRTQAVHCAREPFAADPTLRARLSEAQESVPALVLWGESDRIVKMEYGRHFAQAMGEQATFKTAKNAGHFPLIEQPDETNADPQVGYADALSHSGVEVSERKDGIHRCAELASKDSRY